VSGVPATAPLLAVLALAGTPLVVDLVRRSLHGSFGADHLAGISIVASTLLGEYLAGAVVVLMLAGGNALEQFAVAQATSVLRALARRVPTIAHRRIGAGFEDIPVDQVVAGDELSVLPHEICPVDGEVIQGHGSMDESYLTGEPFTISKGPGAGVLSGAVNGDSSLAIRTTRVAADSRYARIMRVMQEAEQHRPNLRRIADRLGAAYTPLSLGLAAAAWWWSGDPIRFLSVIVVATPCPLIIAIPIAIIGAISTAARRGIIIRDPGGQAYVRGNDLYRFRYGARDIRTDTVGGDTRTVVIRPDGSEIITVVGPDGRLLRRIRRDPAGREIIIIDNSYRDPRSVGGFYVDAPPPVVNIPYDRYIVDAQEASPDVIYQTMVAPPVQRIDRRYTLDEIRYSPNVRMQMPSIDVNTINFETGSWTIPPDQAEKLQAIADGLNRAIQANPRVVFLIEGHTDAVGNEVDNLSLSDRRAQSAAELLTQQFSVPSENLTSQGYGEQYLKEQTQGPSLINRRVTIRNITPLLNGGQASLPPPPPGTAPPR